MDFAGLPCPLPDKPCRLRVLSRGSTLLGWSQEYDARGKPLNADPNWYTNEVRCANCERTWQAVMHGGDETKWTDKPHVGYRCPSFTISP